MTVISLSVIYLTREMGTLPSRAGCELSHASCWWLITGSRWSHHTYSPIPMCGIRRDGDIEGGSWRPSIDRSGKGCVIALTKFGAQDTRSC